MITTSVVLPGSAGAVWHALTDFTAVADWNPFIRHIEGPLRVGGRLRVILEFDRGRRLRLRPRLSVVRPEAELGWHVTILTNPLFAVERRFLISPATGSVNGPTAAPAVRFTMTERMTGLAAPIVRMTDLEAQIYRGYDRMNTALRRQVAP